MTRKIIITTDRLPHAKLRPNNAPRSKAGAALRTKFAAAERAYISDPLEQGGPDVWFSPSLDLTPMTKATITYEWWNPRQIDWDNFLASCKPWQDALQDVGFIKDDKGLSGTVLPWQKGEQKVIITLEEVESK